MSPGSMEGISLNGSLCGAGRGIGHSIVGVVGEFDGGVGELVFEAVLKLSTVIRERDFARPLPVGPFPSAGRLEVGIWRRARK